MAVQHHYGVTKADARLGLIDVLCSGLVAPLNGTTVIEALKESGGPACSTDSSPTTITATAWKL